MSGELDRRIDELYTVALDRFTAERDALVKELRSASDSEGAAVVKGLRKPVASAWALNILAREEPKGVTALIELGGELRDAHRRAVSGGDAEPLREATERRRAVVSDLSQKAQAILERDGPAVSAANADQISSTLDAATVDEEAAELLRTGRLIKPLRPPAELPGASLRVLEGGRGKAKASEREAHDAAATASLERELRSAESRERRATEAVERERGRMDDLERRRAEGRERLRAAEAELRGASLEAKRLSTRLAKLRSGW